MMMVTSVVVAWVAVSAAASVPADGAENAKPRAPAGGVVAPERGGEVSLPALLAALRVDAERRSGGDASRLALQPAEEVTWSDGALGCPQPGLSYTQALVPGWRVRVDVAGAAPLIYHASRGGRWLLCPVGRAPTVQPGTSPK